MVDKELIENWRTMVKLPISSLLFKNNYEGMGEQDKEEFERNFDEILDLALIGLKHKEQFSQEGTTKDATSDTISRQAAIRWVKTECNPYGKPTIDFESGKRVMKHLEQMPSAQSKRKRYRHYKGGLYEVICEAAHHTERAESLVIYRNVKTGGIWARPDWMFYGYTEDGTKRFEEVSE